MTLREMRDRANLSCTQVGKKLFVDQSCVRHWEYGDWAPARKYYKKMAKLYGVSEEEIKVLLQQGARLGTFDKEEPEIIDNVFELNDRTASDCMTARPTPCGHSAQKHYQ